MRHRPLRLPLDRRRRAAAPAAACAGRRRSTVGDLGRRARRWATRVDAAGGRRRVRFLVSAHASLEEMFVHRSRSAAGAGRRRGRAGVIARSRSRRTRSSRFPPSTRRTSRRARSRLRRRARRRGAPDVSALRAAVEAGQVTALYVFDPGPGRIDRRHVVDRRGAQGRASSRRSIVQGVLHDARSPRRPTSCCRARRGSRRTRPTRTCTGRVQAASRVIAPPGRGAGRLADLRQASAAALGANVRYAIGGRRARGASPAALASVPAYAALATIGFARPVAARHWLQASNPSERWKWDFMFQDLPPVKFAATPRARTRSPGDSTQKVE